MLVNFYLLLFLLNFGTHFYAKSILYVWRDSTLKGHSEDVGRKLEVSKVGTLL